MSLTSGSFTVRNAFGEALSAVIDEPSGEHVPRGDAFEARGSASTSQRGLAPVVIVCHGFRNTKESAIVVNLSRALLAANRAVVRFDRPVHAPLCCKLDCLLYNPPVTQSAERVCGWHGWAARRRFDFAGNGASEGVWGFGNYSHEVSGLYVAHRIVLSGGLRAPT